MAVLWSSADAVAATGGHVTTAWQASGVSIDSRSLVAGDLFVALQDARDGHDFVAQALAKGAAAALVSRIPKGVAADAPLLIVADVLAALEALGRAARARTTARVIGVTGSVGKTSTKEMLRVILAGQGRVHAAEASYNNHWGVPLTLARLPVACDFAVIEIGMNHPGETAPLARMARLDLALITTIAAVHLEAFDSIEAIAREKAALLDGLEPGGIAVLPADLPVTAILTAKAAAVGVKPVLFGTAASAAFRLIDAQLSAEASIVQASCNGTRRLFKVSAPGRHFVMNALASLAVAESLGLDATIAAHDLGRWQPPAGRGTRERILMDVVDDLFFDLIDDAFNANPTSLAASLAVLAISQPTDGIGRVQTGRRIAVLGDMLELGPTELSLHAAIAELPALADIATIHCVGPRMRMLYNALPRRQRGDWVATAPELAARAHRLVDAGDIVLVKGSKGSKLNLVVDALRKLRQGSAAHAGGNK